MIASVPEKDNFFVFIDSNFTIRIIYFRFLLISHSSLFPINMSLLKSSVYLNVNNFSKELILFILYICS